MNISSNYRPYSYQPRPTRPPAAHSSPSGDRVTLSAAPEKRDLRKMGLLGGLGTALGVAAVAVLCPAAGLGAMAFAGLMGGVTGAAIGDGALQTAGTRPAKDFDPFNINDVLDPDNLYHPRNPFNPANPIYG